MEYLGVAVGCGLHRHLACWTYHCCTLEVSGIIPLGITAVYECAHNFFFVFFTVFRYDKFEIVEFTSVSEKVF